MKEKIKIFGIGILVLAIFTLCAILFGDNELAFGFFIVLVMIGIAFYYTYKESVRREEEISKLKEEIRELKNK
ncbi:unnamed protein product [marine sediment metagenome]|uniref:Uncharacterized protein n=1 Tax=marine sediment metagenome TaxID=412755 RepID=X1KQS1_9ZZZZ